MLKLLTLQAAADQIQTLMCVGIIIHTLQILAERKEYSMHGLYRYTMLEKPYGWMKEGWGAWWLESIFAAPCYLALITVELVAALVLLSHLVPRLSVCLLGLILLVHLLTCLRNQGALDGADQMESILLVSLFLFALSNDLQAKRWCLFFICFQAMFSYVNSGRLKAGSSVWREGTALEKVIRTTRFRNETCACIFTKNPDLSVWLSWGTLVFECLMPVLVFTGIPGCIVFLSVGILFHLSIALAMGMNLFFWTFVATYPAILFFSNTLQQAVGARGR